MNIYEQNKTGKKNKKTWDISVWRKLWSNQNYLQPPDVCQHLIISMACMWPKAIVRLRNPISPLSEHTSRAIHHCRTCRHLSQKPDPFCVFYLPWTCKVSRGEQCNGCQPVAMPEFSINYCSFPESAATTNIFDHGATCAVQRCGKAGPCLVCVSQERVFYSRIIVLHLSHDNSQLIECLWYLIT